ncbi:hypothetical protein N9948_00525 [bacterium]|nr:hypothetical protein [bacterium]
MFTKINIWDVFKSIAFSEPIPNTSINLKDAIDSSYGNYRNLPQEEKDRLCIELAQRMGCKSNEVLVCSNFIYSYAYDEKIS